MKIVRFEDAAGASKPGILTDAGVVDVSAVAADLDAFHPQRLMEVLIDNFEQLRPGLEAAVAAGPALPLDSVKLRAPLPRPSKILCCIGNYWEHAQLERDPRNLNMFLKSPEAIIGPGDTVRLPAWTDPYTYQHEAELALVFKGPAKDVSQTDWKNAVFGYTLMIDVSAREKARSTWRQGSWMGKSFDTFAPMGPCIVTADEITEPNSIHIQFWNDGQLRHDYNTDDMEHRVPELVEFATGIMTMNSGDVLSCGTNHEGLGNLQDGETCVIEGEGIGSFSITVSDPLKRKWERGIYKGENTTSRGS
ncbi:MAG: fumarylacetoacetate hydrolase family protein [Chloroflexi bacterium]|nr:fumarylacetoacetate hydrolase family protein [Chloroflexota bacterium]MDA1173417.1 fumarylacetoacetate hydrolase family protein [Chloroflexota bacterium]